MWFLTIDTRQSKWLILDSPIFFILFFLLQVTYSCNALSDAVSTLKTKSAHQTLLSTLCCFTAVNISRCLFQVPVLCLPTGASHVQRLSLLNGFAVLGVLFFFIGDLLLGVEELSLHWESLRLFSCKLHFWQNDPGLLCPTKVMWRWNRKLGLQKKNILLRTEPVAFWSQVWCCTDERHPTLTTLNKC